MVGSPEIYGHEQREAEQSVNFVTCHDGFTLNDLVSYNQKHNEANGEHNNDGTSDNHSWNCGVEGPTDDAAIDGLRNRQVKNFLTLTLVSLGTPMILAGDEFRHTQRGNNNAYCQDNELSWLDWSRADKHADVVRFASLLCARRSHRGIQLKQQRIHLKEMVASAIKAWHGINLDAPNWSDDSYSVALSGEFREEGMQFCLMLNAYWEPLDFQLPKSLPTSPWRRWIDTALASPDDIVPWEEAPPVPGETYRVQARSVVMLYMTSNR